MHTEAVRDFNMLFHIVCTRHEGPIVVDFGRQMKWEGVTAGQCTQHVHFIQTEGLNVFLDTRTNKLVFSEGTAEALGEILHQTLDKEREIFAAQEKVSNRAQQQR